MTDRLLFGMNKRYPGHAIGLAIEEVVARPDCEATAWTDRAVKIRWTMHNGGVRAVWASASERDHSRERRSIARTSGGTTVPLRMQEVQAWLWLARVEPKDQDIVQSFLARVAPDPLMDGSSPSIVGGREVLARPWS